MLSLWDRARAGAGRKRHFPSGLATRAHSAPPRPPEAAGGEKTGQTSSAWHRLPPRGPPSHLPSSPCHGGPGDFVSAGPRAVIRNSDSANCRRQPSGPGAKGRYEKKRKERRHMKWGQGD